MGYIPSETTFGLKRGEGDHADRFFVNAKKSGKHFSNTKAGMAKLAKLIAKHASGKLEGRSINFIGRGPVEAAEAAEHLLTGKVKAWQYLGDGYDQPKWQIALGFIADVKAKNDGYLAKKAKRTSTKAKKTKSAKSDDGLA